MQRLSMQNSRTSGLPYLASTAAEYILHRTNGVLAMIVFGFALVVVLMTLFAWLTVIVADALTEARPDGDFAHVAAARA